MNDTQADTIFESCIAKQEQVKALFNSCSSAEEKYQKIIEIGREFPTLSSEKKTSDRVVPGCQSIVFLYATIKNGKVFFEVDSEALISKGLAVLLLRVYSGESPEVIIKCPPSFIQDLGLQNSLTPSRSNGLASIYLKMKQEALKFLIHN